MGGAELVAHLVELVEISVHFVILGAERINAGTDSRIHFRHVVELLQAGLHEGLGLLLVARLAQ